jgi:hypothetical protein
MMSHQEARVSIIVIVSLPEAREGPWALPYGSPGNIVG